MAQDPPQAETTSQPTLSPQAEVTSQAEIANQAETTNQAEAVNEVETAPAEPTAVQDDIEQAKQLAAERGQSILIIFSADWCHWCHQLIDELKQDDGSKIRSQFVVVELDIDLEPNLASRFQAETLPALRLVDAELNPIATTDGYRPLPELWQWLQEQTAGPTPALAAKLQSETDWAPETLKEIQEWLVHASPKVRQKTLEMLKPFPQQAGHFFPWLTEGRLMQRLAVLELFKHWQAPVQEINPWEPPSLTAERLMELEDWVRVQAQVSSKSEP